MLDSKDFEQLINVLKEFFYSKEEMDVKFGEIRSDFSKLQTATDTISKQIKDYHEEMVILVHRIDRMEKWIKEVAAKVGVPYNL